MLLLKWGSSHRQLRCVLFFFSAWLSFSSSSGASITLTTSFTISLMKSASQLPYIKYMLRFWRKRTRARMWLESIPLVFQRQTHLSWYTFQRFLPFLDLISASNRSSGEIPEFISKLTRLSPHVSCAHLVKDWNDLDLPFIS